jgi:hypothetical protein
MSYGKVKDAFWTHKKVRGFTDDAKLLALYFMSGPHRNILGCMRIPSGYVTEDLGWSSERLSDAIAILCRSNFICRDDDGWTLILGQLEHDPLKIPNHARAAITLANEVPTESPVYQRLVPLLQANLKTIEKAPAWHPKAIAIPEPCPAPCPPTVADEAREAAATEPAEEEAIELPAFLDRRVNRDRFKLAETVLTEIVEIVGAHSASKPAWLVAGEVLRWLDAGADPQADVLATVRRIHAERAGKPGWPPGSPAYFAQPIADAVAARTRPMPEARKSDEQADKANTERSAERVAAVVARLARKPAEGVGHMPGGDADAVLPAVSSG